MRLVYRYRVKDKHAAELRRMARAVNVVWNFCNETQQKAARGGRLWLGYHELAALTAGAGKELDLHSHTVQRVCREYDKSRRQHRRPWLRFRARKSLGWLPFNTGHVSHRDGGFVFRGQRYDVWLDRAPPEGIELGAGSFCADAHGRWYLNVPVEIAEAETPPESAVGIDLGLTDLATLSTGEKIMAPRLYRQSEWRLATAQQARKTRRARAVHAKIRNRRKDYLHKESNRIAKSFGLIAVGDVSPSKLARTRFAKSTLVAGWADFKRMLAYKAMRHGGSYVEIPEAYSSQTCSACGVIAGPKGRAGLNKRMWRCDCGAEHDRDVNAARNILRCGLASLAEGAHGLEAGNSGIQAGE